MGWEVVVTPVVESWEVRGATVIWSCPEFVENNRFVLKKIECRKFQKVGIEENMFVVKARIQHHERCDEWENDLNISWEN